MLRKFVYLLALARERHFGRAAAGCHVSQPTLSNAIRMLEDELGVAIVDRGRKFLGFTPEGMKVLEYARRIVGECESLQQELAALGQNLSGHLRLGVIPTALPTVGYLTAPFAARYPHIRLSIHSLSSREIQRRIDEFALDAGITYLDAEPLGNVRVLPLYSERYLLLTKNEGRFEDRNGINWSEAAELSLCMLSPDMQNRRVIDAAFRMVDRTVPASMETDSILNLYTAVKQGPWSSIIPSQLALALPMPPEMVAIPLIAPQVAYVVGIIYADRTPPVPTAKALAAFATDEQLLARFGSDGKPEVTGAAARKV